MRAQVERTYDELERQAGIAIMHANAANSRKRVKSTDLFRRPSGRVNKETTAEDIRRKQRETIERLSRFKQFNGKLGEEEINGL